MCGRSAGDTIGYGGEVRRSRVVVAGGSIYGWADTITLRNCVCCRVIGVLASRCMLLGRVTSGRNPGAMVIDGGVVPTGMAQVVEGGPWST